MQLRSTIGALVAVAALGASVAACADEPEPLALTEETTAPTVPLVVGAWDLDQAAEVSADVLAGVAEADRDLVLVEANLTCNRQSTGFAELSDIERLRDELVSAHGVDAEVFADFQARAQSDEDLRSIVRDVFLANCAPG